VVGALLDAEVDALLVTVLVTRRDAVEVLDESWASPKARKLLIVVKIERREGMVKRQVELPMRC
jgi:hypothetical protein